MTTLESILIAAGVLAVCLPLSSYFADKAGIPDYGCNQNQKPGWTVLYVGTMLPAAAAFWWLVGMVLVSMS